MQSYGNQYARQQSSVPSARGPVQQLRPAADSSLGSRSMANMNFMGDQKARDHEMYSKSKKRTAYSATGGMANTAGVGGGRQGDGIGQGNFIANLGLGGAQSAGMQQSTTNRLGGAAQEFTRDGFGNFYNAAGQPVDFQTVQDYSAQETPLWQTAGYQGDSYIRGMVGMDAGKAYEMETKRGALQGLIGAMGGSYGGGGFGYGQRGGFQAQGPGGMVAQGSWGNPMQYSGAVNPYQQIAPPAAMQQSAMPQMQGQYGGQGTFNDVMMGMGQQSMVDAGRANRQMQGQYYGNASDMQNQGVLGGLGLMNQQQRNMGQRQNDMFQMSNQWGLW